MNVSSSDKQAHAVSDNSKGSARSGRNVLILQEALRDYPVYHAQVMEHFSCLPKGSQIFIQGRARLCHFGFIEKLVPREAAILDIGCGHGYFPLYLTKASPQRTVVGIDANKEKIEIVKPIFDTIEGLSIEHTNVFDLKAEGRLFDVCILLDVLYLIPFGQQETLLAHICNSIIRPGGVFIMKETVKSLRIQYLIAFLEECLVNSLRFKKWMHTFYYRSKDDWIRLLKKTGFTRVEVYKTPCEKINNYSYIYKAYH